MHRGDVGASLLVLVTIASRQEGLCFSVRARMNMCIVLTSIKGKLFPQTMY